MENLSPKEIYEQKKNKKLAGEKRTGRFRMFKKILIWLAIVLVISGIIYWLAKKNSEKISERKIYAIFYQTQSRDHIDIGQSHPDYNSNPPTSGWHYESPAGKGIYKKELADEQLIHNLEHGYIWISYRPDANPEIIKQLEDFYSFGKKIIIEPRKENDQIIAIAAWGWLDKFDPESNDKLSGGELKRVSDFIDAYINQGPEPNAP